MIVLLLLVIAIALGTLAAPGRGRPATPSRGAPVSLAGPRSAALVTPALALALALACAATIAITVAGFPAAAGLLAAVVGVLTAAASARRLRGRLPALAVLLVSGLVVLALMVEEVASITGTTGTMGAMVQQELGGGDPFQFQMLSLLLVCWANGAWVGWLAIREHEGVAACAMPMVVLVADLVNIPPVAQGSPLWPVLVATATALALIGWTHQEQVLARWAHLGVALNHPRPRRSLGVLALTVLCLTALSLLLPPLNSNNISQRFFHNGPQVAVSTQSQRIAPISGYSNEVVPGGPIRQVATPVLTYQTSAPGGSVYLQGAVLSKFVNGAWYEQSSGSRTLGPGEFVPFDQNPSQQTTATALGRREASLTVTYLGAGAEEVPDLLYPGTPLQTPFDKGRYIVSGTMAGRLLLTVQTVDAQSGVTSVLPSSQSVTTFGSISDATAQQLESAGTDYPSWLTPYRSLPAAASFIDESELADDAVAMAGGATNPYLIAVNIQDALRSEEIYTLQPPTAPAGTWPILYFLNYSHRGYCQYFASSMGAMLRTLGIPARLVSGFGPGEEGRLRNGQRLITQADAHTWVQVFFPGYGWVNFEPTPDGFYQPTGAAAATTTISPSPNSSTTHAGVRDATSSARPNGVHRHHHRATAPYLPWLAVAVLAVIAVAAAGALFWTRRARSPRALRRRLELLIHLTRSGDPGARTMTELAQACAELERAARDQGLAEVLLELATAADRLSFGPGRGGRAGGQLAQWSTVSRRYPMLLWRAWQAGRGRGNPFGGAAASRMSPTKT